MKPNAIWRLPAVSCTSLSNTGNRREPLYASGFRRLDILICEGIQRHQANMDELRSIGPRLISEGWTLCTWHSTTGKAAPATEAEAAWMAIRDHGGMISGHVLNGETWYEGAEAWRTRIYLKEFQRLSGLPMASWPMGSEAPQYAREFDYASCVELGCMIYPQQYQNTFPGLTIPNGDANLETAHVPIENRGTSPGCYIGAGAGSIPWDTYAADLRRFETSRPVLLYAADLAGFDPVQAAKLVFTDTPPEPEPEDDMEKIGVGNPPQDGITAMFNRMRDMDPGGTLLVKGADGKWPSIDTLAGTPLNKWKAYDKGERSQRILVEDHDAQVDA